MVIYTLCWGPLEAIDQRSPEPCCCVAMVAKVLGTLTCSLPYDDVGGYE